MMKRLVFLMIILLLMVGVGSASYGNYASFTYNISSTMGTQTNYQVKFILSNSTGTSGYYAPDNIIYTNGSTRPDWYDINATDGSGNPLSFWVENNTFTTKNATVWVKVPTISTSNTSTGRIYYGDPSQSVSTMNGQNTFPALFDDFNTLNTTTWTNSGATVNLGFLTLASIGNYVITSATVGGVNTTLRFRQSVVTNDQNSGWEDGSSQNFAIFYNTVGDTYQSGTNGVSGTAAKSFFGSKYTGNHTFQVDRNTTSSIFYTIDDISKVTTTTYIPSNALKIRFRNAVALTTLYDWAFVSSYVPIPPITSSYSTISNNPSPVSSFTTNYSTAQNTTKLLYFSDGYYASVIGSNTGEPSLLNDPMNTSQMLMWYSNGTANHPWYAYSSNGINWTGQSTNLTSNVQRMYVYYESGYYYMYGAILDASIHCYRSNDRINFVDMGAVINTGTGWKSANVANSFVWKEGSTYYMKD
jgi:hypothetical protein